MIEPATRSRACPQADEVTAFPRDHEAEPRAGHANASVNRSQVGRGFFRAEGRRNGAACGDPVLPVFYELANRTVHQSRMRAHRVVTAVFNPHNDGVRHIVIKTVE